MASKGFPVFTEHTPVSFSLTLAASIIGTIFLLGYNYRGFHARIDSVEVRAQTIDREAIERDRITNVRIDTVVQDLKETNQQMLKVQTEMLTELRKANR